MSSSGGSFTQFQHNRFMLWTGLELQRDSNGEVTNILVLIIELDVLIQSLQQCISKQCTYIPESYMNPLVQSLTDISTTIKSVCNHKFAPCDRMNIGCIVTNSDLIVLYANKRANDYSIDLLGKNFKNLVSFLFEDSMQKLQLFVKEHHSCIELLGYFCGHMFKFMGSWLDTNVLFCMYKL
jgi:hypothetical protein